MNEASQRVVQNYSSHPQQEEEYRDGPKHQRPPGVRVNRTPGLAFRPDA